MQEFPFDKFISHIKSGDKSSKMFLELFKEIDLIFFLAAIKGIEKELSEYQDLILIILKPSIDIETKKAKRLYSYKPSRLLFNTKTNRPLEINGFRDVHRQQFIELAYIGLYHKIENAEKILLERLNKVLKTHYKDLSELNFENKDKTLFVSRDRLRVVANCFKHNMGNANQQVCSYYPKMILNKTIKLNFVDFKKDIRSIKRYYNQLSFFLVFFNQKKMIENLLAQNILSDMGTLEEAFVDVNNKLDNFLNVFSKENIFKGSNG